MNCKICQKKIDFAFKSKIMSKYDIIYYHCNYCGFMQTETPYWLNEAYANPINISDTGYMMRNISLSKKLMILLFLYFDKRGKYLDFASGYGVLVRLMRDIGFDFYWDDKYTENLFARGFEYDGKQQIEAITSLESFEHFVQPIEEIEKMLNISKNIIFTTQLLFNPIPKPDAWWYYGLDHGQHIAFYSKRTLQFIAKKYGLKYYNFSGIHIFTGKILPWYLEYMLKLSRFDFLAMINKLTGKTWEDHEWLKKMK